MATLARLNSSSGQPFSLTRTNQLPAQLEAAAQALWGQGVISGGEVSDNGGLSVKVAGGSKFLFEGHLFTLPAAADFVAPSSESLSIADNAALSMGDVATDLCFWVNIDVLPTPGNTMGLVGKWQAGDLEYLAFIDNTAGTIRFKFSVRDTTNTTTTTVTAATPAPPVVGTLYFVHCYHDPTANTIGIAVNNAAATTAATSGGVRDGTAAFTLGSHTASNYYDGRVQSVGVWKGTPLLTAAQLTALYNSGAPLVYTDSALTTAIKTNLVSWWDLGERSDGTAAVTRLDSHGANDLTDNATVLSGAPLGTAAVYNSLTNGATNALWATITRTAATASDPTASDTYALTLTSNTTDVAPSADYFRLAYVVTAGGAVSSVGNAPPGKRVRLTDPLLARRSTVGMGEAGIVEATEAVIALGPLTVQGVLGIHGTLRIE